MEGVMDLIRSIRAVRTELKVQPGMKARVLLRPKEGWAQRLMDAEAYFTRLAGASSLRVLQEGEAVSGQVVSAIGLAGEALMPLGELVDIGKEIARLEKEAEALRGEIARSRAKLANEGFVKKAPPALVQAEEEKIITNQGILDTLTKRISELKD